MNDEKIEIVNRQRKIKVDARQWRGFAERAAGVVAEAAGKSLTIAFVSDVKMRELNKLYRGVDTTTDVLSFASAPDEFFDAATESSNFENGDYLGDYLGDIVISLERAARQAAENRLDFDTEIRQLILHGILHLCGYDHETDAGEMNRKELQLRDELGI
jgi:probable rRNA maturation factor